MKRGMGRNWDWTSELVLRVIFSECSPPPQAVIAVPASRVAAVRLRESIVR
jgi:hypothetical protein